MQRTKRLGFKAGLLASVAVVVPLSSLMAQTASTENGATELAPIVVDGVNQRGGTGPVRGYAAKQTTTGSKTSTLIREIPQSVSVVGREELQDRGVVSKVDEALRYTPGVVTQPYGADPDTDWFFIRGFDASQTGVSLDNMPFTSTAYGNFQLDAFMQERVEVLKGPASVLVGGANAGGVINLARKRPTDEPFRLIETGINTDKNGFFGFDLSDRIAGHDAFSYRLTGKIAGGENYVDQAKDFRGVIMPQVTYSPTDVTNLNAYAYLSTLDQVHTTNGLLPYVGTVVPNPIYGKIGRREYLGDKASDIGKASQALIGYEFDHEFENGVQFTQIARYGRLNKHEKYMYAFDFVQTDGVIGRWAEDILSEADSFNLDNRIDSEIDVGTTVHKVMAGIDYRYYNLDTEKYSGAPASYDPLNPPSTTPFPAMTPGTHQRVKISQIGIYAQDQIRFGEGWLLTLNGRYDRLKSEGKDPRYPATDFSLSTSAWSGRAGLAYEFENGLTPYLSASTFFSPLIGRSVDGPLKPEEGTNFEVGVKYEPTSFDGMITASLFQLDKENFTVNVPGQGDKQLGDVRSRGVEVEGKVDIDGNWKAIVAGSYNALSYTKYPGSPEMVGNSPYAVPRVMASLWLDYTVTEGAFEGLSVGGGARYRGKSWADNENTLKVPNATVFDAAIRYKKDDWQASLNVTNLFDKEYVSGCATKYFCGYGEARTVMLRLAKSW